jgi:hypothetical protein
VWPKCETSLEASNQLGNRCWQPRPLSTEAIHTFYGRRHLVLVDSGARFSCNYLGHRIVGWGVVMWRALLLAIATVLASIGSVQASVVDINLTGLGTTETFTPGCYCTPETLYTSPVFNLPAGNTYNFGTLTFPYMLAGGTPDEGPYQPTVYFTGDYWIGSPLSFPLSTIGGTMGLYFCGYSYGAGPGSPQTACVPPPPIVVSLVHPTGGDVQVDYWGANYLAPTPLPAALPLLATGLCALGLLGWGRKRKTTAAIAA